MAKAKAKAATKQIETAGDKYRRFKNLTFDLFLAENFTPEILKAAKTKTVVPPSGMPFVMRELSAAYYSNVGSLPMNLASKLEKTKQNGNSDESAAASPQDEARLIEFASKAIRYACIDPRIVEHPQADNELGFDDITLSDYTFLVEQLTTGGPEAKRLASFR